MKRIAFAVFSLSILTAPLVQAQSPQMETKPWNSTQSDNMDASNPAAAQPQEQETWSRGETIPNWEDYVIQDYRGLGLWRPAWNHRWIRIGSDYVLINKTFGTVVNVVRD